MKKEPSDFERDESLGLALRRSLEAGDDADAFTARVLARFEPPPTRAWDALAGWSRWGVAAAATIVLIAAVMLSDNGTEVSVEAALAASNTEAAARLMTEDASPAADILFTMALEGE
jgi:anti-sigma-K factor RskA